MSKAKSAGRGFLQGATFGFSDELGGGTQAGLQLLKSLIEGKSLGEASSDAGSIYRDASRDERDEDSRARAENPNLYDASEFAGGLVPGLASGGAGAGANAARAASSSALRRLAIAGGAGALNAVGHGDGDHMVRDAATGAATAAAGNYLAGKLLSKVAPKIADTVASKRPVQAPRSVSQEGVGEVIPRIITLNEQELKSLTPVQIYKLLGLGERVAGMKE